MIKEVSHGDVMHNTVTIDNNIVVHNGKLLRKKTLKVLYTRAKKNFVRQRMVTRLLVVTTSQYIQIAQPNVHLKLMCYLYFNKIMSFILQ